MSLTTILTQFALTVGASLAERVASALSARIKQEPKPEAKPVDIAIATKSAVSADREGKIASERGKAWSQYLPPRANYIGRIDEYERDTGDGTRGSIELKRVAGSPTLRGGDRLVVSFADGSEPHHVPRSGVLVVERAPRHVEDGQPFVIRFMLSTVQGMSAHDYVFLDVTYRERRLGDYGPGGGVMARDLELEAWVRNFFEQNPERLIRYTFRSHTEKRDQRKHEATHGWRNPPSVYEEDRSET